MGGTCTAWMASNVRGGRTSASPTPPGSTEIRFASFRTNGEYWFVTRSSIAVRGDTFTFGAFVGFFRPALPPPRANVSGCNFNGGGDRTVIFSMTLAFKRMNAPSRLNPGVSLMRYLAGEVEARGLVSGLIGA